MYHTASYTGKLFFSKMVPTNYIFKSSVLEARSFLAVLVRMIKLYCRKKLTLKVSVAQPQSFISNCAKSAAGPVSLQDNSPPRGSSGSNLFLQLLQHTWPPGCQSKERGSHRVKCCPLSASTQRSHMQLLLTAHFSELVTWPHLAKGGWDIWGAHVFSGSCKYLCQSTFQGQ